MKYTNLQFIEAVKNSLSMAEVMRTLGIFIGGSNYESVKRKIKTLNLDTTHFTGAAWNQKEKFKTINKARLLKDILIENSTFTNSNHLKIRLFKENIKEYKCEVCKRTKWLTKPISLELHHINGIKSDLRIENLQILCPNCHSFTDNYRGKNISK